MSAAILQGTPATTLDTDLWVDLPERAFFRLHQLCHTLDANVLARTTVALCDDSLVNFLFRVDGLRSFAAEYKKALQIQWLGMTIPVLPIQSIIKSKKVVGRPKDLAHLPLLRQTLACNKRCGNRSPHFAVSVRGFSE